MIEYTGFGYCPSCGKNHIHVHEKNAMKCDECGYVYFHNTAAAVAGIVEIDDKVLFTVRNHEPKKGYYDLPGGFVDYNETAEAALARELYEELGLSIEITSYLATFPNRYCYGNVTYFTNDLFFVCRPSNEMIVITPNEEIYSWKLFDVHDLPYGKLGFGSMVQGLHYYAGRKG